MLLYDIRTMWQAILSKEKTNANLKAMYKNATRYYIGSDILNFHGL